MSALKRDLPMSDETRIALLEQSLLHINMTLSRIEDRFNKIEIDMGRLHESIHSHFKWTMGVMISLFSGLYATFIGGILAKMFGVI
jgi:hypothetical protein